MRRETRQETEAEGSRHQQGSEEETSRHQQGSALVVALMIMVIMTLLGLTFMLTGETEAKIGRNMRDAAQAGFMAEGAVRMVRDWFEYPTGSYSYLVPTTSQMDRTLRWVDDNNDGTYAAYTSATAPWNVVYRNTTDDPFEKPYRGTPALTVLGTEDHPDIRISSTGSSGEQTYLTSLNSTLYTSFPAPGQQGKITQIDVYGPPILVLGGVRVRYGIATVKVTAKIFEYVGTAQERVIATRVVKAVLNEAPYPASGPIQSCMQIDTTGEFAGHWGLVTSVTSMDLANNLDSKVNSGIPWYNIGRIIAPDMDGNGTLQTSTTVATPDDQDHDGTLDWNDWAAGPDIEDPWLRFWAEGDIIGVSPGCTADDCQPNPFFQSPSTFGTGTNDHSNLFKNVTQNLCPDYEYAIFKAMAQSGNRNTYYYASDGSGTGTFKLNGSGSSIGIEAATNNKNGLFFFDTTTNSAPVDADGNGVYDNLTNGVMIAGGSYQTAGLIYMNADFRSTGSGGVSTQTTVIAPAEPYIDANGNGVYDSDEWFVDLTYPGSRTGSYHVNGMRRVVDGYARQDPSKDVGTAGKYATDVNVNGILYTNGKYDAQGNWIYFGTVVTKGGLPHGAGTPDIYFDERLVKGGWPPPELGLPRTLLTAWETE